MNMIMKTLALSFLAAQVFASCMVDDTENKLFDMSGGEPVANYQITGTVNDEDGNPVTGIRVIADYSTDVIYCADTLYTDKEGRFSKFMSIPRVDKFFMSFTDIDGSVNGGDFESESREVKPVRTEMAAGHFGGSFIVSTDVALKKK